MGCCISCSAKRRPHQWRAPDHHLSQPKLPAPEHKKCHVAAPPPAASLEEETVKEVLSETPIPNLPQTSQSTQQKTTQIPIFHYPKREDNKRKDEKEIERTPEISQTSEVCSITDTYSTTTTATTATAVTEIREDEITSKKTVNRSLVKAPIKRPYNGERERGIKPPVKRELSSQARAMQRNEGSVRVGRELRERSGQRSASAATATRTISGSVVRGAGESPANITGKSGGRRGEAGVRVGSGVKKQVKSEENDSVPMHLQHQNELVSLEDPLVSLECFIFV